MKIAVISSTVFPCPPAGYAGLEAIAWHRAKGLAAKGHEVTLIAPEGSSCEGCTIIPTGPPGGWDEAKAFEHYKEHLGAFEAIVDDSWTKHSYLLKIEGKLKAPVLGVMHAPVDTMYKTLPDVEKPCFVCISKDQAAHFEALFSREARCCYNGVDVNYYKPLDVKRTERFLFLARFSTIKGPDIGIEACKKAGVGLDLIGDTSITNEPDYLKRCLAMADGKQIKIVGSVSRGETVYWYSQASVFLHPNKTYREPFGLAPVEAMLCGLPVIAWKYGALKETVAHGVTGMLVNSVQQMIEEINFYKQQPPNDSMRKACRDHAMQFSIENMVNRYEELIKEAVEVGW